MTRLNRRAMLAAAGATGLAACSRKPEADSGAKLAETRRLPDATETADLIRKGEMTASEAVDAAIARAQKVQPEINFLVTATYDRARERAKQTRPGPFAGVPYLIKDLEDVTGVPTRRGSRSTEGLPPPEVQTDYINAVFRTGVISIGKSATPEEGYLPTTEPLAFGPTKNPWDPTRSAGGSSGGAAAAVAAGVTPMAQASDGGGSIRLPSSNCGVFGLKPSRRRMIGDEPTGAPVDLSVRHCVSRSVRDSAGMLAATEKAGAEAAFAPVGLVAGPGTRKLKVALITKTVTGLDASSEVSTAVEASASLLETLGHAVEEGAWPVDASFTDNFFNYWALGAAKDVALAAARAGRPPDEKMFEPFTLEMAREASALPPEKVEATIKGLLAAEAAYDSWIANYDVVISPCFRSPPHELGFFRGDVPFETLRSRLFEEIGYTPLFNVTGAPAMSVPLGWSAAGLPIGVQFGAAKGAEKTLLELAFALEEARPWAARTPEIFAG